MTVGADVFRTDRCGAITLVVDATIRTASMRACSEQSAQKAKRGGAIVRRSRRQDGKRRFVVPGGTMQQKQWWERYWFEIGYFGGIVAGIGFCVACFYYAARSPGPSINVLLCCAGAASGWFVGILTSPSTDAEKKDFSTYGKAISAFLSGVVLAKADSIFEQSIQANHEAGVIDLLLLRALLFGTTFIVAATVMFAGRRHPIA